METVLKEYFSAFYDKAENRKVEALKEFNRLYDRLSYLPHNPLMSDSLQEDLRRGLNTLDHWRRTTMYVMERLHKSKKTII
jgi:hypothetical protein